MKKYEAVLVIGKMAESAKGMAEHYTKEAGNMTDEAKAQQYREYAAGEQRQVEALELAMSALTGE